MSSAQLKSFHNELLTQLEQKVELDSRYLSVSSPPVPVGSPTPPLTACRVRAGLSACWEPPFRQTRGGVRWVGHHSQPAALGGDHGTVLPPRRARTGR